MTLPGRIELPWISVLLAALGAMAGSARAPAAVPGEAPAATIAGPAASDVSTAVVFSLPKAATTSAGVYNPEGTLIRTLWRGDVLAAGAYRRTWDGRDDAGQRVASGSYRVRLLHHRLKYVWEGVIGNSSSEFDGPRVHRGFLPPSSIAIEGDTAYYAVGFNEQQPGIHAFRLTKPQEALSPLPSADTFVAHTMIASDGPKLYSANTGGFSRTSFVAVFDLARTQPVGLLAGFSVCSQTRQEEAACPPGRDYHGVIDVHLEASQVPTGLAVQRSGRILAIAHGGQGVIRLFDKTSGELLGELAVPMQSNAINQLAMAPGGDLWVISGTSVIRFAHLEDRPTIVARIDGFVHPVALATAPYDDDAVWVADGGSSQQVKRSGRDGRTVVVAGLPNGYNEQPRVAANKLCFRGVGGREQSALALTADRTLWVVDYCNNRTLRFHLNGGDQAGADAVVAYLPHSYASTVDHGRPTRVFSNFLEFSVDTGGPLRPGASWKLERNWLAGLPPELVDEHAINNGYGGFLTAETLGNGRTYAMLQAHRRQFVVELPSVGPLRIVRALPAAPPGATWQVLYEDGALGRASIGSRVQSVWRWPLEGFDVAGDPVWSSEPLRIAEAPALTGSPAYRGAFSGALPARFPVTGSGEVVFFDPAVAGNDGFHLGAVQRGEARWRWQASPSGLLDGKGSFQTTSFDASIQYGGNSVWAAGRHIIFGFHGEFFRDPLTHRVGQANQFMHYDESGLFLGQFGQPSTRVETPSLAGVSGNAFSPTLVRSPEGLYLYHNDEFTHGGVHRWRIDGADDIQELTGTGDFRGVIELR